MFKVERMRRIREILFDRKQIDVTTLSKLLHVSDATIRNDLEELEQEGYLTRYHGGATLNSVSTEEPVNPSIHDGSIKYDKAKEEIGIIASKLIKDKEWIFLGPGSTTYYIAKALLQRSNVNVLTNNFLAAHILSSNLNSRIIFLGGNIYNEGLYTVPEDIEKELHDIYLSKAFFSTDGADLEAGYTISDLKLLDIIKTISSRSMETIFALDHTKFGHRTFMKVGDLDFAQTVITNENIPTAFKNYYLEHGICTYTTFDLNPLTF